MSADLLALQCLAQTVLDAVKKFSGSSCPPPVSTQASSKSRRLRRQATLRKLYAASVRGSLPVAEDVVSHHSTSKLEKAEVCSRPSPQLNEGEPFAVMIEVDTCIADLGKLQLRTYDCSLAALRARLHARLKADAELLTVQLKSGIKQLRKLSADMDLLAVESCPIPSTNDPVVTQPALALRPAASGVVSGVSGDPARPFQGISNPLGAPVSGWGPLFNDSSPPIAPQQHRQECKQQ